MPRTFSVVRQSSAVNAVLVSLNYQIMQISQIAPQAMKWHFSISLGLHVHVAAATSAVYGRRHVQTRPVILRSNSVA